MTKERFPIIPISSFNPWTNKDGDTVPGILAKDTDLYRELLAFKEGAYGFFIKELRSIPLKEDRSKYKLQNLIAFTFGCYFKEGEYRKQSNIKSQTGVIYIDIDASGCEAFLKKQRILNMNYLIQDMRDQLFNDISSTIFAGLSCSGTGVFLLIKCLNIDRADVFEDIKEYIFTKYEITIDVACKDIGRLTFATYDTGAKIRHWDETSSWVLSKEYLQKKAEIEKWKKHEKDHIVVYHKSDAPGKIMNRAISMINKSVEGERHNKILAASRLLGGYIASNLLNESYVYESLITAVMDINYDDMKDAKKAIEWGIKSGKENPLDVQIITPDDPQWEYFTEQDEYRQREIRKLYQEIHELIREGVHQTKIDLVDLGRRFYVDTSRLSDIIESLYERFSFEFGVNHMPNISKIEAYLTGKYDFKRDVITGDLLGRYKDMGDFRTIKYENIWREVQKQGFKFKYDDIVRLLNSDYVPQINPWEQYFASIIEVKAENGDEIDYIELCAKHIKCRDRKEQPFFNEMFKKMLVRTVKCGLDDNYANRTVMVLVSSTQSNGKSTFIRWLSPFGVHQYYAENALEDNKDSRIRMSETFIYNLEELATISKIEINRLKATISQVGSRDRKPFGRQAENIIRRCSFWGSTNLGTFLTDDVNTRWLCFDIESIDWNYVKNVDKDQMWRQAYQLYRSNYNAELSLDESQQRDSMNKNYQIQTVEADLILKYFKVGNINNPNSKFLTATTILEKLLLLTKESRIKISVVHVGRALSRLGFERKKYNNTFGYWIIPINQDPFSMYDDGIQNENENENTIQLDYEPPF